MSKLIKTEKKVLKAVPPFNYMFLTCNKTEVSASGIILPGNTAVLDEQIVLKSGPSSIYKPGDTVKIDARHYMVRKMGNQFTQENNGVKEDVMREAKYVMWPIEEVDGIEVMYVPDNYVLWSWPKGE